MANHKIFQLMSLCSLVVPLAGCQDKSIEPPVISTVDSTLDETVLNDVKLESKSFMYDGQPHFLEVSGLNDSNIEVIFTGNGKTDPGEYHVFAQFFNTEKKQYYRTTRTAVLTVLESNTDAFTYDSNLTSVVFPDRSITYTGKGPDINVENLDLSNYVVSYSAERLGSEANAVKNIPLENLIDVGTYIITANIKRKADASVITAGYSKTCVLKITPKQLYLKNVYLRGKTFQYNGTVKNLSLADLRGSSVVNDGFLNSFDSDNNSTIDGVINGDQNKFKIKVNYVNNGKVESGQYVVTASFSVVDANDSTVEFKNYEAPSSISATMSIVDSMAHTVNFVSPSGVILKTVNNVIDGSSIDESVIPDYVSSAPSAYNKIFSSSELINIREDKNITVSYQLNTFNINIIVPHGTNNPANRTSYTYIDDRITLLDPIVDDGYRFVGYERLNSDGTKTPITHIENKSTGDITIAARIESLDGSPEGFEVKSKRVAYSGSPVTADIVNPTSAVYDVFYINSEGIESKDAPVDSGIYQVRVEVRDTIDGKQVKYKDIYSVIVIEKKKAEVSQDDLRVMSDDGLGINEALSRDENGVYSILNGENYQYSEDRTVSVIIPSIPSYLKYSVTYSDFSDVIYRDGVSNAGMYIAHITFVSYDSNYDAPDDIYIQILISKKEYVISRNKENMANMNDIFPSFKAQYLSNHRFVLESKYADYSGNLTGKYKGLRVLRYEDNQSTDVVNKKAYIYLVPANENYVIAIPDDENQDQYYMIMDDPSTGERCLKYGTDFVVEYSSNLKTASFIYKDSTTSLMETLQRVDVSVNSKIGSSSPMTEEFFSSSINVTSPVYEFNSDYRWNEYLWVKADSTGNPILKDGVYQPYDEYIVLAEDDENLFFTLVIKKKEFSIRFVDPSETLSSSYLESLNYTHKYEDADKDLTVDSSSYDSNLYVFEYFYTDPNNIAGTAKTKITKDDVSDITLYAFFTPRVDQGGYKTVYRVITGEELVIQGDVVTNINQSFTKVETKTAVDAYFKVVASPTSDGKIFRGWFLLDENGKPTIRVNNTLKLTDKIVADNVGKYISSSDPDKNKTMQVYGIFEQQNFDLVVDLGNNKTVKVKTSYMDPIDSDTIKNAVLLSVPSGYKKEDFLFLDESGNSVDLLSSSFRYKYLKDTIFTVKYIPREVTVNFKLPATLENGMPEETLASYNQVHGEMFSLPNYVSRPGYSFVKWSIHIGGKETVLYSNTMVDLSLLDYNVTSIDAIATFVVNNYKVYTIASDGKSNYKVFAYGQAFNPDTDLPVPVREGYIFTGWYLGNSKLKDLMSEYKYTFTSDIVLYAYYRPKKYNLKFYNGNSQMTTLVGYTAQYGYSFILPEDTGLVKGMQLEGFYLDRDYKYKITSFISCEDYYVEDEYGNKVKVFSPSTISDQGNILIYMKYVPKVYNVTLIMDDYMDLENGVHFKTETHQIEYGVTGNLHKLLLTYSLENNYYGPYTDGKVFLSWNFGNQALDIDDINLTYNYDYDIVITCNYARRNLGETSYLWTTEDAYYGKTYSGVYDRYLINPKNALYGDTIDSILLTDTDAKNQMLTELSAKVGGKSVAGDAVISSWYYLKPEYYTTDMDLSAFLTPIDYSKWVLTDKATVIKSTHPMIMLAVFSRPSYQVDIFINELNENVTLQSHDGDFKVHNKTPYNVEMRVERQADGTITYNYKMYEMIFKENGERDYSTPYITFSIKAPNDYNFDGRSFKVSSSEGGEPIQWYLKPVEGENDFYQLVSNYDDFNSLISASNRILNGFDDASSIIISPVFYEKQSISIKYLSLDNDNNYEVFYHTTTSRGNKYTMPSTSPSSTDGRKFIGWMMWDKDHSPSFADSQYQEGVDKVIPPSQGIFPTFDDSDEIIYIAKFTYNSILLNYKIDGSIIIDENDSQSEHIIKNENSSESLTVLSLIVNHYRYDNFKLVDDSGESIFKTDDLNDRSFASGDTILYKDILDAAKGRGRLYLIPSVQGEYIGLTVNYIIHYQEMSGNGNTTSLNSFYGPFIVDKGTDDLLLYDPYKNISFDSLNDYGYLISYQLKVNDAVIKDNILDYRIEKDVISSIDKTSVTIEGWQVYDARANKPVNSASTGAYSKDMRFFFAGDTLLKANTDKSLTTVFIPSLYTDGNGIYEVKKIGDSAFAADNGVTSTIKSVKMARTITAVGEKAFYKQNKLETIYFSDYVSSIGNSAFEKCELLRYLICPSYLKTIGVYAFRDCFALESVLFNQKLESIGDYAFTFSTTTTDQAKIKAQKLTELIFPSSLSYIGNYSFTNRYKLSKVCWSELKKEKRIFDEFVGESRPDINIDDNSIDQTVYKKNVEVTIGDYAFSLLNFDRTDTTLSSQSYEALDGYVPLTSTAEKIEDSFLRFYFPTNIVSIGSYAFYNRKRTEPIFVATSAENLRSLNIGNYAFYVDEKVANERFTECLSENSTSKTLMNPLKLNISGSIGERAFENRLVFTNGLEFNYNGINKTNINTLNFSLSIGNYAFSMGADKGGAKQDINGINKDKYTNYELKLPYCTTSIGAYAFFEFYRLKGLSFFGGIPTDVSTSTYANNLKSIGVYAFSVRNQGNMSSMTYDVTLNAGIQSIGKRAFNQRKDIKNFNFDSTSNQRDRRLSYIGDYAFYNCVNLKTCNVADSRLSYLGMYAFAYTTSLSSSMTVGGTLNTLSEGTFYNSKITSCTLTSYVRYINAYAFYNCNSMTSLYLNGNKYTDMSNIYVLGDFALAYCSSLGSSVRFSINTFSGGRTLTSIDRSGSTYKPQFYTTYNSRADNLYSPSLAKRSSFFGLSMQFNLTSGSSIIRTYRLREKKENGMYHNFGNTPYWYNGKVSTGLGFFAFYNTQNLRFHTSFNNSCGATGVSSYTFYGSSLLNDNYIDTIFPKAIESGGMIASHAFTTGNGNITVKIGKSSVLTLSGYVDPYGFDGVTFITSHYQTYYSTYVGKFYTRAHPVGDHLKINFPNNYVPSFIFAGSKASYAAEIVFPFSNSSRYISSFALYNAPFSAIYIDTNSTNAEVYFRSFSLLNSKTRSISATGYSHFYAGMAIGSAFCASVTYSRQMTDPGLGFYGRRTDKKDDDKYYYGKNGCGGYGDECNKDGYMYAMALYNELTYIGGYGFNSGSSYSVTHNDQDGDYKKDNLMLKWYGNNEWNSFDVGDQKDNKVEELYSVEFRARYQYHTDNLGYNMNENYGSSNQVTDISVICSPTSNSSTTGYN